MATYLVTTLIERYVTGSWSSISPYVVSSIEGERAIVSNEPTDLLAAIGEVAFTMNNGDGRFSPNSAFKRGTPIRITTTYDGTSKVKFKGTILELEPDTTEWGDQYVRVTAVDWMNFAVNYPMIVPQIQSSISVQDSTAYLLSLMDNQPDSVTYHVGREEFEFAFDTIKEETFAYSELNKLALSEFAPIYLRAGNELVIESANTRHGQRTLTEIPVRPSDLEAILTDPNGGRILLIEGTSFAILADDLFAPNLASGTVRPMNVEMEHGANLLNQVSVKAYTSIRGTVPEIIFSLEKPVRIPALGTMQIRGAWADPNGGSPINAFDAQPMVTGTDYQFIQLLGDQQEYTSQLIITQNAGAEGFVNTIFNNGVSGWITKFNIRGYAIRPYNPIEALVGVTGSIREYGNSYLQIDQKYQNDQTVGLRIAEMVTDDEREPQTRLISVTFDASSSPEFMQAAQHMDIGDLTHITNVKPLMDAYAYIQGKEYVITPAGVVTEKWYLKEADTIRKGLKPIALNFSSLGGGGNGVNFGMSNTFDNLPRKTLSIWIYNNQDFKSTFPMFGKYDGVNGFYFFQFTDGRLHFRENFTPNDGAWNTASGVMTGTAANMYHHIALTYDNTSDTNVPKMYLNGAELDLVVDTAPSGVVDDNSNASLVLGNVSYPTFDFLYIFDGRMKNARIYDEIKTPAEIADLASTANQDVYINVPNDLVFQGFAVKTEDYSSYAGTVLYPNNKLIDSMYGIRGTPNWNIPSGTAWALRGDG